jgi:hypothetical protein
MYLGLGGARWGQVGPGGAEWEQVWPGGAGWGRFTNCFLNNKKNNNNKAEAKPFKRNELAGKKLIFFDLNEFQNCF